MAALVAFINKHETRTGLGRDSGIKHIVIMAYYVARTADRCP